ncbi:insulinase family protein [Acutalibacter muris]|uniref:Insulinase family protein n=1 Tax=Acutalibacter muris TaxID=1796620 RepID=A0A1Z2XRJ3_9FIRM|nr:pitrilysin family protein [Acutalibacter muris]ANU55743.1 peptidase M16 [Hungateiclostridiaceae bacterium KB18]ASB41011.1 peptidase M16 [Acutalibacter muris]QQR30292.1 insulinase family protein [Acutalibacter muris]
MELKRVESARTGDFYYKGRHPSGLDIYLYPKENGRSTRAVFGTKYGSIDNCFQRSDEASAETFPEGIAHYLEHKLFESEDGDAFARYAETGANANAFTGFESTCYVFSCTDRLYDSLRILLDFVQSPYFTEETVAKEQGIIGQEIKMYEDLPGWRVFFNYLQAMYHSHPVRKDAAGTIESIAEITPEHLYRCYNTFYNLNNMALVLSGKFDVDKVITVCDEMLKPSPLISVKRVFPKEPDTVVRPFIEQKLSVAMPVFQFGYKEDAKKPRKETDMAAMSALLAILASDASPMFRKLLDGGLINEASFSRDYFEGSGYATVMFGGESRDPEAAAELIRSEVARLQKEGITEEDFRWAKRSLYGESISALNHAAGIASWVIDFAFKGMELFTYIDALAGLTLPQVRQKLETLRDDRSVLSVIWPI